MNDWIAVPRGQVNEPVHHWAVRLQLEDEDDYGYPCICSHGLLTCMICFGENTKKIARLRLAAIAINFAFLTSVSCIVLYASFYALHYMQNILLYGMHNILYITIYASLSRFCILCIVLYA